MSSNKVKLKNEITYTDTNDAQLVKLTAASNHLTLKGSAGDNGSLTCGTLNCTDLTVTGTTTAINTTNLEVEDNIIVCSKGENASATKLAGLAVNSDAGDSFKFNGY